MAAGGDATPAGRVPGYEMFSVSAGDVMFRSGKSARAYTLSTSTP